MIKLKHKDGYFGTSEVGRSEFETTDTPYYLEFIELPFSLISKNLDGTTRINLTNSNGLDLERVFSNINVGIWVEFK